MELEQEQEVENVETVETEAESEVETESSQDEPMTLDRLREMANNVGNEEDAAESSEVEPEAPAYEPNLTYRVRDEEKKIDDWLVSAITDKEKEERIRDLYTKAEGLDAYKEKYSKLEEESGMYYNQTQQLTSAFKALQGFRDSGDYEKLQQALGLSDQQLVDWAMKRVEEHNMPEEQRSALMAKREYEAKTKEYERQLQEYEAQQHDALIQNDLNELESLINSESVRPIAEAMAARGQNFVEQVLAMGQYEYKRTGVEPSIESVVNKIAGQNRWIIEQARQETQALPVVEKKKTLPTVNGSGQTRVTPPKIRTLEDLKKLANSL